MPFKAIMCFRNFYVGFQYERDLASCLSQRQASFVAIVCPKIGFLRYQMSGLSLWPSHYVIHAMHALWIFLSWQGRTLLSLYKWFAGRTLYTYKWFVLKRGPHFIQMVLLRGPHFTLHTFTLIYFKQAKPTYCDLQNIWQPLNLTVTAFGVPNSNWVIGPPFFSSVSVRGSEKTKYQSLTNGWTTFNYFASRSKSALVEHCAHTHPLQFIKLSFSRMCLSHINMKPTLKVKRKSNGLQCWSLWISRTWWLSAFPECATKISKWGRGILHSGAMTVRAQRTKSRRRLRCLRELQWCMMRISNGERDAQQDRC